MEGPMRCKLWKKMA